MNRAVIWLIGALVIAVLVGLFSPLFTLLVIPPVALMMFRSNRKLKRARS